MPAFYAGKRVGKPLLNGHTYNALFNGKLVWPLDKDTVVSIEITDDSGKTIDNITLRVGEEKYLKVRVLPTEASQEFTPTVKDQTVASVGAPTPKTIAVTPDSLTLRVGESGTLSVLVGPDGASQEYTADITDKNIATIKQ